MLNIVLFEPEIPANTGNIGRTCVATNTRLHLIEPLGFRLNEKNLKRAGMDYWEHLDVRLILITGILWKKIRERRFIWQLQNHRIFIRMLNMNRTVIIMFGKESAGIPEEILCHHKEDSIRIPMIGDIRSLNLSNSVAIVLYEALRQHNFTHMNLEGHLRNYDWK
mgnify:CR=1 FL=1